jgi:hypothetical protein
MGDANALRDTSSPASRNENDSAPVPANTTWRSPNQPASFVQSRKVLNLCEDSKSVGAVTIHVTAQNKFTNRLSLAAVELNFQTSRCHYADK